MAEYAIYVKSPESRRPDRPADGSWHIFDAQETPGEVRTTLCTDWIVDEETGSILPGDKWPGPPLGCGRCDEARRAAG